MKFAEAPRQVLHPDISYAQASRVVESKTIDSSSRLETDLTTFDPSGNGSVSVQLNKRDSELVAIVEQYLEDTGLERPHSQVNALTRY